MDPQEKEKQKNLAWQFLTQQGMCTIATISPENTPEAASVAFFMDHDWTIYIVTHPESRKLKNISSNPKVAIVAGTTLIPQTVQIEGTAEIMTSSSADFPVISEKIKNSGKFTMDPIIQTLVGNYVILKIHITWLRYLRFDQAANKANYAVIIP